MKVNFTRKDKSIDIPQYETSGAAAVDFKAWSIKKIKGGLIPLYEYDTGISAEVPNGYFIQLASRSSVSKLLMWLANGIGIIDSDYRGTIRFRFRSILGLGKYKVGERIGQGILLKRNIIQWNELEELSSTERGEGGFGHTGR